MAELVGVLDRDDNGYLVYVFSEEFWERRVAGGGMTSGI